MRQLHYIEKALLEKALVERHSPAQETIPVFDYTDHIHLPGLDLALDPRRRSSYAFVSHGHSDHIGRHLGGFATPETVALVAQRLRTCQLTPLAFGEVLERSEHRIWLAPAGHVLGAAQLVVDDPGGRRLVYTGDFNVRARRTTDTAEAIRAEILIMECTYGLPRYVFPSDDEIREQIRVFVQRTLDEQRTPVLFGYSLGKAQEAMAWLQELGYPVRVHRSIAQIAEIYRCFDVELGDYAVYDGEAKAGEVVILPPGARPASLPPRSRTLYLSGWALDRSTKYRLGVDEAVPFSDHADFSELVEFVQQVQPARVYTTHGPSAFADHLCRLGFHAEHLGTHQLALF